MLTIAVCGHCRSGLVVVDRVAGKGRFPLRCPVCKSRPSTWETYEVFGIGPTVISTDEGQVMAMSLDGQVRPVPDPLTGAPPPEVQDA